MPNVPASLEDRLFSFLETVPLASIERELAQIAPGCEPHAMSVAEVIRTLGVAGIAALAGVRRSTVLEAAGPESCAIADLIEPNPYGHLSGANVPCCAACAASPGFGPSFAGGRGARIDLSGGFASRFGGDPDYYRSTARPALAAGGYNAATGYAATYDPAKPTGYAADYAGSYNDGRRGMLRRNPEGPGLPPEEVFVPEDGAPPVSGGFTGWPGAVPFRQDAWNFSEGWYILQRDDTFSGLATTYLGSPARWMEIWSLQPYRYTKAPDPSSVKPGRPLVAIGERVIMPAEAVEQAREYVRSGAPSAPAIGGTGGTPKGAGAPLKTSTKVAIGVVAAVVLVGGGIALSQ